MRDEIKSLLTVQERDLELDRLGVEVAGIPGKMAEIKASIAAAKKALEDAKKEATTLQLAKKQKEIDLDTQDGAIRKHSTELNSVKTNEAYRALMGEIDKAKQVKSTLEDDILQLMEQIDVANKSWKEKEAASKNNEAGLLKQISDWEAKQKQLEETITAKRVEFDAMLAALPKNLSEQYNKLRKGRRGAAAVVPLRNEQCTGCHMKVSQNLINEVRRGQKMMTCESCSRIVYLEEVPAEQPQA